MRSIIHNELTEHLKITNNMINSVSDLVEKAAEDIIHSLKTGNKILICGNGGSAADAQHIAAEIVGRYKTERKGLPAIALTTDSSILTAVGNDFGFQYLYERQVEALAKNGDTIIGISTGGSSKNVINALNSAKKIGCKIIGLSGKDGGDFNSICDVNIVIPSSNTPRIQEMHILVGHIICQLIDDAFKS
jgi:D-sedoheptulose 7-phosphate isomerase